MLRKKHNLIGRRFELGVVVSEVGVRTIGHGKYPRQYQEWLLKCDCGQEYITTTQHLLSGNTRSCGCLRRCNLLGKRFGYGIVIAFAGYYYKGCISKRRCVVWKLRCDCGNEYETISEYLTNGNCSSCGCMKKNFHNVPNMSNGRTKATISVYFKNIQQNAKRRGYDFCMTQNELLDLFYKQNSKCALSNETISFENKTASLDRIDNTKGYSIDNVQWVHRTINFMKNTLLQQDFIQWCHKVSNFS
jgi:hypothetical protein